MNEAVADRRSFWPWGVTLALLGWIALTITMAVIAIRTDKGIIDSAPYEKGLDHERVLRQMRSLKESGNKVFIATDTRANAPFIIEFRAADDTPLNNFQVSGRAIRGSSDTPDINLVFTESSPGVYSAQSLPKNGLWLIEISLTNGVADYLLKESVIIKH